MNNKIINVLNEINIGYMNVKKYKINRTQTIGSPDAETDELLFDVFVKNDVLKEVFDTKSQKSILLGRTGSGKSAIIQYLERKCDDIIRIEPEAMSLQFLSNSTILRYFKTLEVNMNLFFKVLWKHVFIVELLKLYFKEDYDKGKKEIWISRLRDSLFRKKGKSDPNEEKALKYLENWTDKFWQDTEYRIRELESIISDKFKTEFGIKNEIFKTQIELENSLQDKSVTEVKHKAESIIHEVQTKELLQIFAIMKNDLFTDHQRKVYIVIDDLDKDWIDSDFRYDLIGAMVEVIKELRQFKGVKIVISLRENLTELLKLGSKHEGGQREKFKPLYADMKCSEEELTQFVSKRLKSISENQLDVSNAFYNVRRTGETGIGYLLNRTYMRPRDVISFINHAIENANNKSQFSKDIMHKAEAPYSIDRFQALEDEWRENYGEIYPICSFLNGITNGFKLKSLNEDHFTEIYCEENINQRFKGVLFEIINSWKTDKIKFAVFIKRILFILYHIGIIGIKKGPTFSTAFFYDDIMITKEDISNNNKFYVHPSLFSYFKINTMEQLPEHYLENKR